MYIYEYIYIFKYRRANGIYMYISYIYPKKLQFAAYGQFVLILTRNQLNALDTWMYQTFLYIYHEYKKEIFSIRAGENIEIKDEKICNLIFCIKCRLNSS